MMKAALSFAIDALAVFRLTRLLVKEDGPNRVFAEIRTATGIVEGPDGKPVSWPDWNPMYCVLCTSVWVSAAMLVAPDWFKRLLALSAASIMIENLYEDG